MNTDDEKKERKSSFQTKFIASMFTLKDLSSKTKNTDSQEFLTVNAGLFQVGFFADDVQILAKDGKSLLAIWHSISYRHYTMLMYLNIYFTKERLDL